MHDWGRANDIQNYFMLLMQSVLLVGAGFAMSYGLKENKGARVFFGLGLISVSANFTILGALIYSVVPLDITFVQYPGYAHWVATSPKMLLMGVGAALFVLLPITYFGMSVMSKYRPAQLGIAYLLMNSLLLLPLRDPGYVGLIGLASLIVLSMATRRYFTSQDHLQTPGSTFVKGLLYLPVGVCTYSPSIHSECTSGQ